MYTDTALKDAQISASKSERWRTTHGEEWRTFVRYSRALSAAKKPVRLSKVLKRCAQAGIEIPAAHAQWLLACYRAIDPEGGGYINPADQLLCLLAGCE